MCVFCSRSDNVESKIYEGCHFLKVVVNGSDKQKHILLSIFQNETRCLAHL